MITKNPKEFWNNISSGENWRDYVLPKRTDEEADAEGLKQSDIISPYLIKPGVCVDYGCGVGRVTKHFNKHTTRMIGLDICDRFIKIAKERDKESEYYNIEDFKEKDVADFVFSLSVMQHNDEENQLKILQNIYDILKPCGRTYITFASGDVYHESEFIHKFTIEEIKNLASMFKEVKIEGGSLAVYYGKTVSNIPNELILIATK